MTGVMIEGALKLSDAAQVGEGSFVTRANLAGAPDHLRQVAVRVADLHRRQDHEGSNHEGRDQSTGCFQPSDLFAEARALSSQESRTCRPMMHASPACIADSPPRRRATSSGQTPISQPRVPRLIATTVATSPAESIRTSNHQTRSASGNPHAAPRVGHSDLGRV
jgi:hypothetical protein